MVEIIIGILMIVSFLGMVWYCVKGFNLMVGFFVMATLWTVLAFIGNALSPDLTALNFVDTITNIYQTGPAGFASSILVNIFFGSFFGRILMDTGIAATLIRKVVELGGDKPRITMTLLCTVTALCFTSMTGIGPVISIAVIVMPILQALGIPTAIALFAFMGSIMAGIFANVTNFVQYQGILAALQPEGSQSMMEYGFSDYFTFGMIALIVSLLVTLIFANIALSRAKSSKVKAWASTPGATSGDAPWYSWVAVIAPVLLVVFAEFPIIPAFILAALYALLTCGKLKGGFVNICRMLAKQFADGAVDVAPLVGFLLVLAMFNSAASLAVPFFEPIVGGLVPHSTVALAILFAILAPLGFFRGPLNLVGSGGAVAAVILAATNWDLAFIFPLFAVVTIDPQHLDITQSWVAWGLGHHKVGSKDFMKFSIPAGWLSSAILCIIALILFGLNN